MVASVYSLVGVLLLLLVLCEFALGHPQLFFQLLDDDVLVVDVLVVRIVLSHRFIQSRLDTLVVRERNPFPDELSESV